MQEEKKQIRVLLRFASSGKIFSLLAPISWSVKKLRSFIGFAFKEEAKANSVVLYHGAKPLSNDNMPIDWIIQEKEELVQLIVMLKPKENMSEIQKNSLEISILHNETKKKEIVSQI
jgi:hypothetical protein